MNVVMCCVASTDKMKPAMVAKLAIQCSDLYADALKLLQLESIKSLWPKVGSVYLYVACVQHM